MGQRIPHPRVRNLIAVGVLLSVIFTLVFIMLAIAIVYGVLKMQPSVHVFFILLAAALLGSILGRAIMVGIGYLMGRISKDEVLPGIILVAKSWYTDDPNALEYTLDQRLGCKKEEDDVESNH